MSLVKNDKKNSSTKNDNKDSSLNSSVIEKIQNQIEFYLSDANILKDKFIQNLLKENEDTLDERKFIELKNFLNFKKIKLLTNKIEDLKISLRKSNCLELSEDEIFVRRKNSINYDKNIDACTIYLEKIENKIDHDWIKNVFSVFGKIDHISIPKFKKTKISMGFAFVEFSNSKEALEVCSFFNSNFFETKKNKILSANINANEDSQIISELNHEISNKEKNELKKGELLENNILEIELKEKMDEVLKEVINKEINFKKRPNENNDDLEIKKHKVDLIDKKETSIIAHNENVLENSNQNILNLENGDKHLNKEIEKYDYYLNQIKNTLNEDYPVIFKLRILSKEKWLSYKKDFMKIKKKLKKEKKNSQKTTNEKNIKQDREKKFEKNLILKLVYLENEITKVDSLFKKFLRSLNFNQSIAYIDIDKKKSTCYIRFKDSNSANDYSKDPKLKEIGTISFLENKEEESYWMDIFKNISEKKLQKTKKFKILKKNIDSPECFIPENGLIIKMDVNINLENELTNSKLIEKIKNSDKNILFVEIDESKNLFLSSNLLRKTCYIRCKNPESVKNVIELGNLDKIGLISSITPEEELDYWKKTKYFKK